MIQNDQETHLKLQLIIQNQSKAPKDQSSQVTYELVINKTLIAKQKSESDTEVVSEKPSEKPSDS